MSSDNHEDVLEVEEILQKKIRLGKVEYYVKWKGYPDERENTWEPIENIIHQELIDEFEENLQKTEAAAADFKKLKEKNLINIANYKKPERKGGFGRGYSPERIIGATKSRKGQIKFLMKWKDIDEADYVYAKEANIRCPQIVINFYENNLELFSKNDEAETEYASSS
ncbi:hypothetical protein PVAND_011108 [Polypedilum vanderplanki]|uniref:Chromo domain-containing protein n=1 Tax=Polypedilum vanderplanki TaxID=319348 RepID=A0A9J6CHL4_POLVA|nr:hypothetical protein PVAND_011108 [Polypedilum vanderplanki]